MVLQMRDGVSHQINNTVVIIPHTHRAVDFNRRNHDCWIVVTGTDEEWGLVCCYWNCFGFIKAVYVTDSRISFNEQIGFIKGKAGQYVRLDFNFGFFQTRIINSTMMGLFKIGRYHLILNPHAHKRHKNTTGAEMARSCTRGGDISASI